jgi:hypothetical protein
MHNLRRSSGILLLFSTAPMICCFLNGVQQYFVHDMLFAEVLQVNNLYSTEYIFKSNTFFIAQLMHTTLKNVELLKHL